MRWFGSWRIRTQLAVIVAVALAPAALLLVSTYQRSLAGSRQAAERSAADSAERLAGAFGEEAATIHGLLTAVAEELRGRPESEWPALVQRQMSAHEGSLGTLIAISLAGHIVAGPKRTEHLPIYVGDRPYFREALATRRLAAGEYALSRSSGRPVIHFAVPVLDDHSQPRLVLAAGLDLASCADLARRAALPTSAVYTVTDRRGVVLYDTARGAEAIGQPDEAALFAATGRARGCFYTGRGAAALLHGVATVSLAKGLAPYVYVRCATPLAALVARQRARLLRGVAGLTLATLLAALLAWVMWRYGLARRIDCILAAAQSLGRGDLTARTGFDDPTHELGPLARVVDEAAQALQDREAERRRAEEALRHSEQQLRDSLEYLPLAVGIVDAQGRVRMLNRRHVELFGYQPEQVPDMAAWMALAYPHLEARRESERLWLEDVAEATRRGDATPAREYRVRCADGSTREVEIIHRPLGDLGVTAFVDVTDRNLRAREHLADERDRLLSQSQQSLGTLASGVAHDFNNLLTTIIGGIELAAMAAGPDAPGADDLDMAMVAARRAADLTSQMLAYTGRGLRQVTELDLNDVVRRAGGTLLPIMGERADLTLALANDLPRLQADPSQVERLVVNLITNGLEAVPEGSHGTVAVRTGQDEYGQAELAASRTPRPPRPGRFVWVEVRDDGVGMGEETQRRLFEPFFSTKFAGRGLSLPAAQGMVASWGGAILIDSRPGDGTAVRVLFPLAEPAEPCLLVVDDDDDVRELALSFAVLCGWRAVGAADGASALVEARRLGAELALVLLDLSMPERDGRAVLADLRELSATLPVVVCSGYDRTETLAQLAPLNPTGFLSKPFTVASFEQAVNAATQS